MNINKNIVRSLIGVVALLVMTTPIAYQVKSKNLQELYSGAVRVARVKVVESKSVFIKEGDANYDCGVDYKVEVVEAFKGINSEFGFRSSYLLNIGEEYLVFLNAKNLDANVNYLAMGKNDVQGYQACTNGVEFFSSGFYGEIFEFDSLWENLAGEEVAKVFVEFPCLGKLKAKRVEFKSDLVPEGYLDAKSFWVVPWRYLKDELLKLKSKSKRTYMDAQ